MKILEKTIFKKKNEEIKELQERLIEVSNKSISNYTKNKNLEIYVGYLEIEKNSLENQINVLRTDKKNLENRIREINGSKGGLTRQIHKLKKIIEDNKNSYENNLKELNNELLETKKKLEESMTDKYLVKKIKSTRQPKQKMNIKSGYIEGKIISKIKED